MGNGHGPVGKEGSSGIEDIPSGSDEALPSLRSWDGLCPPEWCLLLGQKLLAPLMIKEALELWI